MSKNSFKGGNYMNETKDLLMKDYGMVNDLLTVTSNDREGRDELLRERDNIRNELIKLEAVKIEAEGKEAQLKAEDKREKIRNGITIGTFVVTSAISIWAVLKTFKFDQEGTITSTLGRGILGNITPKLKR